MGAIQNAINNALGSISKDVAIAEGISAYGKEQETKAKEQAFKEAEKKETIINKGTSLKEEESEMNIKELESNTELIKAKGEVAKANDALTFNASLENRRALAQAEARLKELKELKKIQKDIWQNKLNKGFNTTDVNKEFCLLYGEVSEAYDAWKKKKDDLNEELADIAIYLMGLSEMLGFDLADEIEKKVSKNEKRVYKNIDGVNVRISD